MNLAPILRITQLILVLFVSLSVENYEIGWNQSALAGSACRNHQKTVGIKSSRNARDYQFIKTPQGFVAAYLDQIPSQWNGKTLVLISGLSRSSKYWNRHAQVYLSKGYRVIRPDLLNIGETLKKNGIVEKPTLNDDARLVQEILHQLDIRQDIYVFGHSRGAGVSVFLTKSLGSAVNHMILANPYVHWLVDHYVEKQAELIGALSKVWNPLWWNPFTRYAGVDALTDLGASYLANVGRAMVDTRAFRETIIRKMVNEKESHEFTGVSREVEVAAVMEILKGLVGVSTLRVAAMIKTPTLIIAGTRDTELVPTKLVNSLADQLQNSRVQHLDTGHHAPITLSRTIQSLVLQVAGQ